MTEKIIPKEQFAREIKSTFSTFIAFAGMATLVFIFYRYDLTLIHDDLGRMSWWWWPLSFGIIHTTHDAYFYWSHRLLHGALRSFHAHHHLSYVPTPLSAYSFHFVEAMTQAFFFFMIAFIVPTHWSVLMAFFTFQTYINMWGHTIYEFWPEGLMEHPVLKILNTPTHHVLHHENGRYNFGIYYNFWDKFMKTNHPDYKSRYADIIKKRKG